MSRHGSYPALWLCDVYREGYGWWEIRMNEGSLVHPLFPEGGAVQRDLGIV